MQIWQVALLLNVSLAVGFGFGYGKWGLQASAFHDEITALQAQVEKLERERDAREAGADAGRQQWEGRGVVRAVSPRQLFVTHEEIAGLLPRRTTGFRVAASANHDQVAIGDTIRFWLHGTAPNDNVVTRMETW